MVEVVFSKKELVVSMLISLFHSGECPVNKITAVVVPCPDFEADAMQMSNTESYLDLLSMGVHDLLRMGQSVLTGTF